MLDSVVGKSQSWHKSHHFFYMFFFTSNIYFDCDVFIIFVRDPNYRFFCKAAAATVRGNADKVVIIY